MSDNDDDLTVTRAEIEYLREKLEQVSDYLVSEMSIALTGQSHCSDGGLGIRRPQPGSRAPYSIHVESMLDELQNELSTTVRHICEVRGIPNTAGGTCTALAQWLIRYRYAIPVMTDGAEIFEKLCHVIDRCAKSVNTFEREYVIDDDMVKEANRSIVTMSTIDAIARRLGDVGKGLNRERMRTLTRFGGLEPTSEDEDTKTKFYRLGDVLEAHRGYTSRKRRKSA